ncbi:MAG: 4Fe-4S binding protein [Deltaproteobacteria bacterium]|nr:4Fe-4S binding protein [Deltaproteobacteria bacterium]MBW2218110.1 4Fe-4S binding protein [Deltaproteobacteria bacterium]
MSLKFDLNTWLKKKYAINTKNWDKFASVFQLAAKSGKFYHYPIIGRLLKRISKMDRPDKNFTQGYILNINKNLIKKAQNVVLPIDIMRKAVKESTYRAIMHKCICRDGAKCSDYPTTIGCIFIGEGSRVVEERGIAREANVEEALEHIDKAASLGLIGQCIWIEAEEFVWGFKKENLHRFLEICFCCPCCCASLRYFKEAPSDIQRRLRSVGWKATINNNCNSCGICLDVCSINAISLDGKVPSVSDKCLGCGLCSIHCPVSAVEIIPEGNIKNDIKDYFEDFSLEI